MTPSQMAAIHAQCFKTPRPWKAHEFAQTLEKDYNFCLHETQGFILGRVIAGEAELTTLAVAPTARRQGIARRLMDRYQAEIKRRRAEMAHLEVALDNHAAQALYLACGWHESGIREGYYRHPNGTRSDALIMMLDLEAPY